MPAIYTLKLLEEIVDGTFGVCIQKIKAQISLRLENLISRRGAEGSLRLNSLKILTL